MIQDIALDAIVVNTSERRAIADVSDLAASIKQLGLLHPITVAPEPVEGRWRLVAGGHRLCAVRSLGWEKVPANVLQLKGLEAELAMIDENLMRNELTVLDRGEHLDRRKNIYEALYPEAKAQVRQALVKARGASDIMSPARSFASDTAAKTGQSPRTIQREVQIAARIVPDVKDAIRETPVADSKVELLELARQKPEVQRRVAERIVEATQVQPAPDKPVKRQKPVDVRAIIADVKKEQKREEIAARPVPAPEVVPARIEVADATKTWPVEDSSVDLIVTSPPYGLDIAYAVGDVEAEQWETFMETWMREAYRVACDGGRMAVNIPLDCNAPTYRPTYAQTVNAALRAGWKYKNTIVWEEGNTTSRFARGTQASHTSVHVICSDEMIPVFFKGEWKLEDKNKPDIDYDDWLKWTEGHWKFSGESRGYDGHPAPFPEELPRRLIQVYSGRGATVLDPFCGSGTTVKVAVQLQRQAIGLDMDEQWVASARRRVMEAVQ